MLIRLTLLLFINLLVLTGCESVPAGMVPDIKKLEGIEIYNERGHLVAGHSCKPREGGGSVCTTLLPDGKKKISYYGPGNAKQEMVQLE